MAQDIEKLEVKIKALQAKKRQATKKAKEKEIKAELERLKMVEKEFEKYKVEADKKVKNYDLIMEQARLLGHNVTSLYEMLKRDVSIKAKTQNVGQ